MKYSHALEATHIVHSLFERRKIIAEFSFLPEVSGRILGEALFKLRNAFIIERREAREYGHL